MLDRKRLKPLETVERLVGMQAQVPRDPYVALWSRLEGFRAADLSEAIERRDAVRMPFLRATLHLVTRRDALGLRPVVDAVLDRSLHSQSPFGRAIEGVDVDELTAFASSLLAEQPRTRAQLGPLLAEHWAGYNGPSLAYACTYLLHLVQVTPRGLWKRSGPSAFTTLETWLGERPAHDATPDAMVLRYLAAFGPATPADVRTWSGLAGVAEILERLGPKLRTVKDGDGRERFDVPRAPLPSADLPAPVRFLPEYDNAVLSHADRTRIVAHETASWAEVGWGVVLVDGFTAARWRAFPEKDRTTLRIEPFRKLTKIERDDVEQEATRLANFLTDGTGGTVEIARLGAMRPPS
ncbi:MAG TPA: winged helix DNA-binding domain-containing protein [Actinomycetota bacterium]|nr:winged helix DNA-binding domain-containing protein [Actinomycetota bacterium]